MRGELKSAARIVVLQKYTIFPKDTEDLTEQERKKFVRKKVAPLLNVDNGEWMHVSKSIKVL